MSINHKSGSIFHSWSIPRSHERESVVGRSRIQIISKETAEKSDFPAMVVLHILWQKKLSSLFLPWIYPLGKSVEFCLWLCVGLKKICACILQNREYTVLKVILSLWFFDLWPPDLHLNIHLTDHLWTNAKVHTPLGSPTPWGVEKRLLPVLLTVSVCQRNWHMFLEWKAFSCCSYKTLVLDPIGWLLNS